MSSINEPILLGKEIPSGARLRIEIELYDKDNKIFVTYGAFTSDRQKGGTATVEIDDLKEYLFKKVSKICDELV